MDRLHAVFEGMFDGVWMVAPDGHTTYANAAMAALLGVSRAAMQSSSLHDHLDPSLWDQADDFLGRQRTAAGERIELPFRRADGGDLFGMLAGSPITAPDGAFVGVMLNFSDVTGKRAFEAKLAQNVRMQAIGEFAGSLAHDFNNLLTALRGHAEMARMEVDEGSSIRADLDQVILSADRAAGITRKLLAFTSRQVLEPVLFDPGQVITDLMPMLSPLLGDDIDVILRLAPRHAWVRVDAVQFEQVIVNLVVNARDAMATGGTLTLTVENVEQPRAERPDQGVEPEIWVRIKVEDTGRGMDESVRARVFDPFFTTKQLGEGTGLGLATVFGILTQSGGGIRVESTPGEGSTFLIDLPAFPAPGRPAHHRASVAIPVAASGVILLVEDEQSVRDFARRALEKAGYTVLSASGGKEALRASSRWSARIDVLLTDVVMHGMHGPEVVALLRVKRPAIGVIYMSGYAQDILENDSGGYDEFVAKPFSSDVLSRAVSRVMVKHRPESAPVLEHDVAGARRPGAASSPARRMPAAGTSLTE